MKMLVLALAALLVTAIGRPAGAQTMLAFGPPAFYGGPYPVPGYAYPYPAYGFPGYPYYPYPLPPAPSLGFGRGGIYGHVFVGRGEDVTGYTFPGYDTYR
jgi:hypothetical protein